jgi:hypothetical protein
VTGYLYRAPESTPPARWDPDGLPTPRAAKCPGSGLRPLTVRTSDGLRYGECSMCRLVRRLRHDGRLYQHRIDPKYGRRQ